MYNNKSFLWDVDAYKIGHMTQYPKDTEYIYSVMQLRSDKYYKEVPVIGLQYLIKEYMCQKIDREQIDLLIKELKMMGIYNGDIDKKLYSLADLGYLPLEIKAIPEGTILNTPNAVCTIRNTKKGFHWLVGFFETLLLKWWSALATASCSLSYRRVVDKYFEDTSDNMNLKPYMVHDFGSRGCMTPEGSAFTGMAHALVFRGSDTINTIPLVRKYYGATGEIISSVPATEHSVMCSYGRDEEISAFRNMLNLYPTGIVSIVSDTYNWYDVMDNFTVELKDEILARDGKVVFRPDSGNPIDIICGEENLRFKLKKRFERKFDSKKIGGIRALDKVFGHTINSKGFKVLNEKVGLIYGDGMYLERYINTLNELTKLGYSAENLTIGVGGILRGNTRDTLGVAFKATCVCRDGKWIDICKDPITDKKKKSYKGFIKVVDCGDRYETVRENWLGTDEMFTVYKEGKLLIDYKWEDIIKRFENNIK